MVVGRESQFQPALMHEPADILVFAPHPDDEVIGCGGVIQKAVAAGGRVRIVSARAAMDVRKLHSRGGQLAAADPRLTDRRREGNEAASAQCHASHWAVDGDYLGRFVKSEEIFWPASRN